MTDEEYQDYVTKEKGPLLESLPSVTKYELVRIKGAETGEIPYNYVGIVHVFITRITPELMGCYGYVRENHYEKYYRDAAVAKLVLGGVQYGYFATCKQFYDLDYSSFGPGKLQIPA